jgi:YVTN family beta-propeller protein
MKRGSVTPKNLLIMMVCSLAAVLIPPMAAAQTGPSLLVLNKADNALAIVDPTSGKVVARVPTGEGPHEIVSSSDGKFAVVTNYGAREGGNTLSMIDLVAHKEVRRITLGALRRPHGAIFADGKVYFTAEANKVIASYDPAADRVDWVMGTGQDFTHMLVASKDVHQIFTSNLGSDTVSAFQRTANALGWKETLIHVGKAPEGIDISPDEKEVWAANSQDGTVSIIDVAGNKVVQTLDIKTKHSNRLKFTLDGSLVLVSDAEGNEVVVIDAATRKERKRIKTGKVPLGILMRPGGAQAYVATSQDNGVAVIDLRTLEVVGSIPTGNDPDGLAWAQAH